MTMQTGGPGGPAQSPGRLSVIDRDSHFSGTYVTSNDLRVEGHYEGEIECEGTVMIAESADVNARIAAGTMSVAGHLQGEIACRSRFEILPSGRVDARVLAGAIIVHEGARYEGELRMRSRDEGEAGRTNGPRPTQAGRRRVPTFEPPETPSVASQTPRLNGRVPVEEGSSQSPPGGG